MFSLFLSALRVLIVSWGGTATLLKRVGKTCGMVFPFWCKHLSETSTSKLCRVSLSAHEPPKVVSASTRIQQPTQFSTLFAFLSVTGVLSLHFMPLH